MEQEEYEKEEISWSYVEFVDNQDVLDLIEKKPGGIIALLDEARHTKTTSASVSQRPHERISLSTTTLAMLPTKLIIS
ncbi:hypothetical protein MKX01_017975 [Papaver californicum]|nr:hypothetical protein MKX01_017975 [Papaver californicum]